METVSWNKTIGHIGIEYTPDDDRLFYGRISTGYRAGSFNYDEGSPNTPPVPTDPVEEETNINYELGVKGIFADDRLRLTAAVYYSDIENYQILLTQEVPPGFLQPHHISPNTEYTANVDGTELSGFELNAEYRLNEQWRVDGYYNFQDSSLGPHSAAIRGNPDNDFLIHEYVTLAGEPMSRPYPAPEGCDRQSAAHAADAQGGSDARARASPHRRGAIAVALDLELYRFALSRYR